MRPTVFQTVSALETQPVDSDDEESITNLSEVNMEKWKRNSSSLLDGSRHDSNADEGDEEEDDEDEGVDENPFLMPKQTYRQQQDSSDENSIEDESDDESIFDKLRDEVQDVLYKGEGPRAIVNRFRDSRVEVMSN